MASRPSATEEYEGHLTYALNSGDHHITAGTNPDRLQNEAACAALCGAGAVDASSGQRPPLYL